MYGKEKKMNPLEKKAKMKALKEANSMAKQAMGEKYSKYKDSPELKKHTKEMSDESGIDFKGDSDKVVDPTHYGNVIGRHVSDENIDCEPDSSTYNLDELEQRLAHLMEIKKKYKE